MNNKERVEDIIKQIEDKIIPNISSHISHINGGGCGVFAYLLKNRLSILGIESTIREIDEYTNDSELTLTNSITNEISTIVHPIDAIHSATNYFKKVIETNKTLRIDENLDTIGWKHLEVHIEVEGEHYLIDGESVNRFGTFNIGELLHKADDFAIMLGIDGNSYLGADVDFELLSTIIDENNNPAIWNTSFDRDQIPKLAKIIDKII